MLYTKREKFNSLSIKIGMLFSKLKLSPNQWTLGSLIPAAITFYFLLNQNFILASVFFFFSAFTDIIDGAVARVTGRVTVLGAYLDTITDRIIEFITIFGLFFFNFPDFFIPAKAWLFILLFGSLMTTYVKSAAFEKGLVFKELRGGIVERSERMILIFLIILTANFNPTYSVYLIALAAVLSVFSAFQRFLIAVNNCKKV